LPAIADDSGLTVEILGGAPGIFSARWSGTKDDAANRRLLLAQLADVKAEHRTAAFVCAMALVDETAEATCTGVWQGSVAKVESGENGFGYDPIFLPANLAVSAAQLAPAEKNAISHRAMAIEELVAVLAPRL
jgi:XTP/dITP diphosphohydrolase